MAELARLVGQADPFKDLFPKAGARVERQRAEPVFAAPPVAQPREVQPEADYPEAGYEAHEAPAHGDYSHAHDDVFAALEQEFNNLDAAPASAYPDQDRRAESLRPPVLRRNRDYAVEAQRPDEEDASPDVWARTEADADDRIVAARSRPEDAPVGSGRTLIVLAAVVVLTGGGLAASFLARSSGASANAVVGNGPPVIMASTGPSKVQPPASANGPDGASEPSTLLDKNHDDGTATAKVVNTIEQPVDLSQAVKPSPAKVDASATPSAPAVAVASAPPPVASPFPEPRKVKTVIVRPDGSIVASGDAAQASVSPDVSDANLAFDTRTAIPMPGSQGPQATATPDDTAAAAAPPARSTARAATSRQAPAATDADPAVTNSIDTDADVPAPPPPAARPGKPKTKPVQEASATPADAAAPSAGGAFAVQLGAPPSEKEARDSSARLQKKFADALGANRPSIHEGKSGDKTVYRIRVSNLSKEDAQALCAKLQSSGGACFVVRN